jgi:hypothetical protein
MLCVEVEGGDIVAKDELAGFVAVYYKPSSEPHLVLRRRTNTNDYELIARVWAAANAKARELGWIV